MQAAFGKGALNVASLLTYIGLGLGLLGSSLAVPFGLFVLVFQRDQEKYIQVGAQPACCAGLIALMLCLAAHVRMQCKTLAVGLRIWPRQCSIYCLRSMQKGTVLLTCLQMVMQDQFTPGGDSRRNFLAVILVLALLILLPVPPNPSELGDGLNI